MAASVRAGARACLRAQEGAVLLRERAIQSTTCLQACSLLAARQELQCGLRAKMRSSLGYLSRLRRMTCGSLWTGERDCKGLRWVPLLHVPLYPP